MFKYIVKRFLSLIPVVIIISILLFSVSRMMPDNRITNKLLQLPPNTRYEERERIRKELEEQYGVNDPYVVQYFKWISNTVRGDLGYSNIYKQPVTEAIKRPLFNTIILNIGVIFFSLLISILAGIKSAVKHNSLYDKFWQVFSLVGTSIPVFFTGLLLIFTFAFMLKWFPSGGMPSVRLTGGAYILAWLKHLVLPTIALTIGSLAGTIRYVRNSMLEALHEDYIRTARAKGLSNKVIVYSHAFRNALIPVVTIVIGSIGALFSGSVITETIFSWQGMGKVMLESVTKLDFDLLLNLNLFFILVYLGTNFITDISYAFVDPRVKLS